ncbi:hypothetical protein QBC41DRAFT_220283 [Cercophora samala]|uniref:Uncharacterized protein n=1 Tax=Cercophora samala TaxID=330535 RepID=A0AA39ZHA5_9PEZI|nr:hypothetical protein QBC41DRAFT_220283 [Cercophora samala]
MRAPCPAQARKVFKQPSAGYGNCRCLSLSYFTMAPFRSILKQIVCHLLCLAGNCDMSDQRSQTSAERDAAVRVFVGKKSSQAEPDRPSSKSRSRVKRKPVHTLPSTRKTQTHVTDAGHQVRKPLPATPYGVTTTTTTATASCQVSSPPPSSPTHPSPPRQLLSSPNKLCYSVMSMPVLKTTLDVLHNIFSHTRYMVIGTAAMAVWGYVPPHVKFLPRQVSILCAGDDLPVIKSWAASSGHCVVGFAGEADTIGIVVEGKARAVRINTVTEETFERLGRVSPLEVNKRERFRGWREGILRTGVWVVALGGLLDWLCAGWVVLYHRENKTKKEEDKLERCGLWILWVLRRVKEDVLLGREWELDDHRVAKEEFWVPFTGVWHESVGLMLSLGLLREANSGEQELRQKKVWTGTRFLYVTSVVPKGEGEDKGQGREQLVSLTTVASSSCQAGSEDSEHVELPLVKVDTDLARYHPDSFRVRAGLRDGSVSMREYAALVAAQAEGIT